MSTPSTTTPPPYIHPWFTDFLSLSSLSLPLSFQDLSLRIHNNLYTFLTNYLLISFLIFLLTLIPHPFTFILFLTIVISWINLLFFFFHSPLFVFGFELGHRLVLVLLSVVTVVALAVTSVWWNLFVSVLVSAVVVLLHACLRTPDDVEESPYGALLSVVVDDDDVGRGLYTLV